MAAASRGLLPGHRSRGQFRRVDCRGGSANPGEPRGVPGGDGQAEARTRPGFGRSGRSAPTNLPGASRGEDRSMRVVVLGLGYVGSVCAACLARDGFEVIGVDVNESKVRSVESGRSPVLEPGLDELIREGKRSGRLRATTALDAGAREADAILVSVGTASVKKKSSDLSHLRRALS